MVNQTLEILKHYTGTTCEETLYNNIETILHDSYVGHLAILEEEYGITEKDIKEAQKIIN